MKVLNPPARIGIIGGGQLGRMLSYEAKRMGYRVIVLDPTPQCPAGQVSDGQIIASFNDCEAIRRLADCTDVLTYEFEHINADILCELELEGYHVYPSGFTLSKIQNKYVQKTILKEAGLPVPEFIKVNTLDQIEETAKLYGFPLVLKTCIGGYDGKGNYIIRGKDEIHTAYKALGEGIIPLMAEKFVPFIKELSIIVARGGTGQAAFYPVVENIHEQNILRITRAPANISQEVYTKAKTIANGVLNALDDFGVFCIEMFTTFEGDISINEIAPRPHNSGHYTIEATVTSQYEQLLRAITGLPLGSTRLISPAVMVNILGNDTVKGSYSLEGYQDILKEDSVYPHLYCKAQTNTLKKIGHVTILDESVEHAEFRAKAIMDRLKIVPYKEEHI